MHQYAEHHEIIERIRFRVPWDDCAAFWEWARARGYEGTDDYCTMDDDANMVLTVERQRRGDTSQRKQLGLFEKKAE